MNRKKNGETYLFSESISPIKDEINGEITHFIGVGEDITRRRANELKIQQALEEKTVLLSEVHHRVKNNLAIVSGLLEMQIMKTPEVEDILKLSQHRIHSIAQAHELMYESENFSQIDISDYIKKMTGIFKTSFNSDKLNVDIKVEIENVLLNVNQAIPLGMLINELVTNSFTHAFANRELGEIAIYLKQKNHEIQVSYSDNGTGLKGLKNFSDFNGNKSLGVELIQVLSRQLDPYAQQLNGEHGFSYSFKFKNNQTARGSSANKLM